mmetsp:Transcript_62250/g.182501  ORF Transcript_62250/g.182501 Transcript_62250/m.182501 type:complete len:321 (+) Transcript_62250:331-1293(+)
MPERGTAVRRPPDALEAAEQEGDEREEVQMRHAPVGVAQALSHLDNIRLHDVRLCQLSPVPIEALELPRWPRHRVLDGGILQRAIDLLQRLPLSEGLPRRLEHELPERGVAVDVDRPRASFGGSLSLRALPRSLRLDLVDGGVEDEAFAIRVGGEVAAADGLVGAASRVAVRLRGVAGALVSAEADERPPAGGPGGRLAPLPVEAALPPSAALPRSGGRSRGPRTRPPRLQLAAPDLGHRRGAVVEVDGGGGVPRVVRAGPRVQLVQRHVPRAARGRRPLQRHCQLPAVLEGAGIHGEQGEVGRRPLGRLAGTALHPPAG